MTTSVNYPQPVQVNGYSCRNCSDVDLAKKHVDPAHPKSGPYNVDAASDPSRNTAVKLGGALAKAVNSPDAANAASGATPTSNTASQPYQPGQTLNLQA